MKRFRRLPLIELLEEKRMKAADLAACSVKESAALESGDAAPVQAVSHQLSASTLEQLSTTESASSEEQGDGTDGTDEGQTDDGTDGTDGETDGTDNGTDGTDDGADGTDGDDNENGDDNGDDGADDENETELTTTLDPVDTNVGTGSAEGESETENGTTKEELKIKVSGLATDGTYNVTIDGTALTATLTVTNGEGMLKLSTNPDDDEETLPEGLVTDGAQIQILLNGTPILEGTLGTATASLTATSSSSTSGGLKDSPATVGSGSLAASVPPPLVTTSSITSSQVFTSEATVNTLTNLAELNLIDASFDSTDDPLDSWTLTEFQPIIAVDNTVADGSISQDAAIEMFAVGALVWAM